MGDIYVLEKPKKTGPVDAPAKPKDPADVVILPGIDMKALADAWSYFNKTGKTHANAAKRGKAESED